MNAPAPFALPAVPVVAQRTAKRGNGEMLHFFALACGHEVQRLGGRLRVGDRAGCVMCWARGMGLRVHEGVHGAAADAREGV